MCGRRHENAAGGKRGRRSRTTGPDKCRNGYKQAFHVRQASQFAPESGSVPSTSSTAQSESMPHAWISRGVLPAQIRCRADTAGRGPPSAVGRTVLSIVALLNLCLQDLQNAATGDGTDVAAKRGISPIS